MKYILFFALLLELKLNAQILNAYARVSLINGARTTLTVTNVNETSHTYTVGGKVIVMQMQDDVIGTNTTNISTFGNLGSIANAGNFEIRSILSRSPAVGTPTSITLSSALTNSYNTSANSSVQVFTFRDMGFNFTTSANIIGLPWDGNIGGVIAFEVVNTLTLNHSISANTIGFIGGSVSNDNSGPTCVVANTTRFAENAPSLGFKGGGIYRNSNIIFNNGRGRILNGGGGGSDHNAGGGGGGNFSTGGQGGNGYNNCTTHPAGGFGGLSLSPAISVSRIFMGGGGGGGQQNNSVGSRGGNGGGIILIKANTLATNTICGSPIRISANGETATNVGNDGAGGGGAAGSIILEINTFSVNPTCTMTINANAGNGGNGSSSPHAGGGGGGQGAVIFSAAQPTVNVTVTTINGLPGVDGSGGTISGTSGGGDNNAGIISFTITALPVELLNFDAQKVNQIIELNWRTASETNSDYFNVEKSLDGVNFTTLGTVKASNSQSTISNYSLNDLNPEQGYNYYRLKQVDFDKTHNYSQIISFEMLINFDFSVFPNPLSSNQSLIITLDKIYNSNLELNIYDSNGKIVLNQIVETQNNSKINIENINLPPGIYIIRLNNDFANSIKKLIIE